MPSLELHDVSALVAPRRAARGGQSPDFDRVVASGHRESAAAGELQRGHGRGFFS